MTDTVTVSLIGSGTAIIVAGFGLLSAQISRVQKVADATHVLSNSAMGTQLKALVDSAKALAIALRATADLARTPSAIAAADAADVAVKDREKTYQDHLIKQAVVDSKA